MVLAIAFQNAGRAAAQAAPRPEEAVAAVLRAFDDHPVVAVGESHGLKEEREFLCKLVSDPRFPDKVNDIVVEFGNARFQGVIDRYLAGDDVPAAELQRVWRERTCPGPQSSSAYPKYFAAFREANRALPPARRFCVLLGDPPIDWQAVRGFEDLGRFLGRRESHFAQVVETEVLAKGRKALLIIGSAHLFRKSPSGPMEGGPKRFGPPPAAGAEPKTKEGPVFVRAPVGGPGAGNVAQLIERKHPGKLFIVLPHDGLGQGSVEIESRFFGSWPAPSLAPLNGTALGAAAASQTMPRMKFFKDGKAVDAPKADPAKGPRLEEVADALLYLGPHEGLTLDPDADNSQDKDFLAELKRRRELPGGPRMPADAGAKQPRRYIDR
jgi:hypothetical protein